MPITLQKSSESASVKWSASHLSNNLTINRSSESRRSTLYGISHKSGFTMVAVSDDGTKRIQSQVVCRIMGNNNNNAASEIDARFTVYIIQAAFINLPIRNLLVLACTKSIQIYELDGTTNLHTHMLDKNNTNKTESSIYARGIAGIGQNLLCVGNHQGEILVFNIPPKGNNIFLKETIHGHQFGITYLVSNANLLISSDTSGVILIKNIRTMSRINEIQSINESGVTSLSIWNNCIVASYANGMIHLFDVFGNDPRPDLQNPRWQLRRASVISSINTNDAKRYYTWTRDELRKQKQVQNDLDIPLTIFMTNDPHSRILFQKQSLRQNSSSTSLRLAYTKSYELVLQHISTLEKNIQQVILLTKQLIENQATVDVGSFELHRLCHEDLSNEEQKENSPINPSNCHVSLNSVTQHQSYTISKSSYNLFPCCKTNQQKVNLPLPSLRIAVDMMLVSLIEFLYANNHFIRTELVSIQSIGDILAFHTLSYSLKDMVEATTDLAKNARRIKRIDIRTLVQAENDKDISY
ncbi:unnamed protein product [Rotaria magnacalcarata]|uniref:WD repeat-containing protein 54 beta-propeller domain-containing protein n=1 Tax=Rotaria magnacalcarata TaxID=392030 RepID=A0A816LI85_9BILA|nr:unnamed protein product [Rotaria magnacalcarata]